MGSKTKKQPTSEQQFLSEQECEQKKVNAWIDGAANFRDFLTQEGIFGLDMAYLRFVNMEIRKRKEAVSAASLKADEKNK